MYTCILRLSAYTSVHTSSLCESFVQYVDRSQSVKYDIFQRVRKSHMWCRPILSRSKQALHCKEISIYVFLEKELHGLSPSFHIHVSVSDLYIPINCTPKHECIGIETVAVQLLFLEYMFRIFGIVSLQCRDSWCVICEPNLNIHSGLSSKRSLRGLQKWTCLFHRFNLSHNCERKKSFSCSAITKMMRDVRALNCVLFTRHNLKVSLHKPAMVQCIPSFTIQSPNL